MKAHYFITRFNINAIVISLIWACITYCYCIRHAITYLLLPLWYILLLDTPHAILLKAAGFVIIICHCIIAIAEPYVRFTLSPRLLFRFAIASYWQPHAATFHITTPLRHVLLRHLLHITIEHTLLFIIWPLLPPAPHALRPSLSPYHAVCFIIGFIRDIVIAIFRHYITPYVSHCCRHTRIGYYIRTNCYIAYHGIAGAIGLHYNSLPYYLLLCRRHIASMHQPRIIGLLSYHFQHTVTSGRSSACDTPHGSI